CITTVTVQLHPVLFVRVKLVRDSEAHRGALERVRGCGLVVSSKANVFANHTQDLQTRLERAGGGVRVITRSDRRQQLECQVPLTGHNGVQALAHRVRLDICHESSEVPSVALNDLSVLPPPDGALVNRFGQLLPHVRPLESRILSCDHLSSNVPFRPWGLTVPSARRRASENRS